MTGRLPPSRYQVIEKDGRLITVDTQTGFRSASEAAPRLDSGSRVASLSPTRASDSPQPAATVSGVNGGAFARLIAGFATFATQGQRDARGRPVLKSSKLFDPQAPRQLALDPAHARLVGLVAMISTALIVFLFLVAIFTDLFLGVIVVAVILGQFAKPILTAMLKAVVSHAAVADMADARSEPARPARGPWDRQP